MKSKIILNAVRITICENEQSENYHLLGNNSYIYFMKINIDTKCLPVNCKNKNRISLKSIPFLKRNTKKNFKFSNSANTEIYQVAELFEYHRVEMEYFLV